MSKLESLAQAFQKHIWVSGLQGKAMQIANTGFTGTCNHVEVLGKFYKHVVRVTLIDKDGHSITFVGPHKPKAQVYGPADGFKVEHMDGPVEKLETAMRCVANSNPRLRGAHVFYEGVSVPYSMPLTKAEEVRAQSSIISLNGHAK